MKLDNDYLNEILGIFDGVISLKPSEFFQELKKANIDFEIEEGFINEKFHRHLEHLIQIGAITNSKGIPNLKSCGIRLGGKGYLAISDSTLIKATMTSMKTSMHTSDKTIETPKSMPKIFISHSSQDSDIVEELIEMLEAMGLAPKKIFCTSFEGYGIKLGEDFLESIKEELTSNTLVIFVLSKNFYKSPVSLCEMGAAWVMAKEHIPVLVPPLEHSDVKGVIPLSQGMKITEPLKFNSLKVKIEEFFGYESKIDNSAWEQKRDKILTRIESLLQKKNELEVQNSGAPVQDENLPQEQKDILKLLFDANSKVREEIIANKLNLGMGVLSYHLDELHEKGYLDPVGYIMGDPLTGSKGYAEQSISKSGRKYVFESLGT